MSHEPLDLLHCGDERRIAAYLVETDDGLALFEESSPDAVLSDLRVADGDGLTLIAEIRRRDQERGRRTAAIAVTGFDSPETRAAARDAGFDQTITKPFQLASLIDAVVRLTAAR